MARLFPRELGDRGGRSSAPRAATTSDLNQEVKYLFLSLLRSILWIDRASH